MGTLKTEIMATKVIRTDDDRVIDGRLGGGEFVEFYFGILLYLHRLSSFSHELA